MAWQQGVRAILHETSQGAYKKDTRYRDRKIEALAKGFLWAGYHLLSDEDVDQQLDAFLGMEDGSDPRVALAIDWELSKHGTMSYENVQLFIRRFTDRFKPMYKDRHPMLYAGKLVRETPGVVSGDALLAKCPLWYARYAHAPYEIPVKTWPTYTLWQFDDENRRYGAPPPTVLPGADWNRFAGTLDDLERAWPFVEKKLV